MAEPAERLTTPERMPGEGADRALRPQGFDEFVGQPAAKANLKVFVEGARTRGEAMDHVLLFGPPGLGKTTLAQIIARELGVGFRSTSGPVIARAGDLAALLTNLEPRDVLFIDEIHRLAPAVEEILYPAMEDYHLDIIIGEGPSARSVRIDLVAVHAGRRHDARGVAWHAAARSLRHSGAVGVLQRRGIARHHHAGRRKARRSDDHRGRIRNRQARARHAACGGAFAAARARFRRRGGKRDRRKLVDEAMRRLEVDADGLDMLDRRYLVALVDMYGGGPVGVDTLAAALAEARDAIEDMIEPYLMQQGFIMRTPRGGWAARKRMSAWARKRRR